MTYRNLPILKSKHLQGKMGAMKPVVFCALAVVSATGLAQNPCTGCDGTLAQAYQVCAKDHGNPCAETNEKGLVSSGAGTKKDIGCCMKKEKHDRCLECKSMDCAYKTCHVNKQYYSEYSSVTEAKKWTKKANKEHSAKAMKAAGWGDNKA